MNSHSHPPTIFALAVVAVLLGGCQANGGLRVAGVGNASLIGQESDPTMTSSAGEEQDAGLSSSAALGPEPLTFAATRTAMLTGSADSQLSGLFLQINGNVPLASSAVPLPATQTAAAILVSAGLHDSAVVIAGQSGAAQLHLAVLNSMAPIAAVGNTLSSGATLSLGLANVSTTAVTGVVAVANPVATAVADAVTTAAATVATVTNLAGGTATNASPTPAALISTAVASTATSATSAVAAVASPVVATIVSAPTAAVMVALPSSGTATSTTVQLPVANTALGSSLAAPSAQKLAPPNVTPVLAGLRHGKL